MKITNVHVGTIHQKVRFANWYENCKLIWQLQSNSHVLVYGFYVNISNFHMRDTAGLKTFSGKEFFGWIAVWMTKTQREQSLAKPSKIHILIQIPVRIQSDSYLKWWFLRSLTHSWHFHDTFVTLSWHFHHTREKVWSLNMDRHKESIYLLSWFCNQSSISKIFCVCLANCKKYHTFYMWVLGMSEGNTLLLAEYFCDYSLTPITLHEILFSLFFTIRTRLRSENNTRATPYWHQNRPTMVAGGFCP